MSPDDLLAYVDNELEPVSRERVERELEAHPEWLAALADLCRQRFLLAEAVRDEARPIPVAAVAAAISTSSRRLAAVAAPPPARPTRLGIVALAAAAVVVLSVGALLLLSGRGAPAPAGSSAPDANRTASGGGLQPRRIWIQPRAKDGASPPEDAMPEGFPGDLYEAPGRMALRPPAVPPVAETPVPDPVVPPSGGLQVELPPDGGKAVTPVPASDPPSGRTVAEPVLARLESFSGKVQILRGPNNKRVLGASRDAGLLSGDAVQVQGKGRAVALYPDATRLEVGADTTVALATHTGDAMGDDCGGIAKKIFLRAGRVVVDAASQPEGLPLLLVTAQSEVRVVGTRFTLEAGRDQTHLEVLEGRVRLTRRQDGAVVEVRAGQYVTATHGAPLQPRPMRTAAGLIALYRFDEGQGVLVPDLSGAGSPIPLRIANPNAASWLTGALLVHNPTVVATPDAAKKVILACQASRELTVEAWVRPCAGGQGGYLVALASNPYNLDFLLEQAGEDAFAFHLRTSKTRETGVSVTARGPVSPERPLHLVYTRAASGAGVLYVDGVRRAEHVVPGDFSRWDNSYRLAVAGDAKGRKPWRGEVRLVAVYNRALAPGEVQMHYRAGSE